MNQNKAHKLAIKALLRWRKTMAFEAGLLLKLKIECPESAKAAMKYKELTEAIAYFR